MICPEPIGANDLLIAASAKATGLILVTNNVGELERVKGLKAMNWAEGQLKGDIIKSKYEDVFLL